MWLIERQAFISDDKEVADASRVLSAALAARRLTLIVGNGPSQSAAWLHGLSAASNKTEDVSWSAVVRRAARAAGVDQELVDGNWNNLALAQAVLVRSRNQHTSRRRLLSKLGAAFSQRITPTVIDRMLVALAPSDVVTTNYDFQLERAFATLSEQPWLALVRQDEPRPSHGSATWIHKMHGSFAPVSYKRRYRFAPDYGKSAEASIVITESDYDQCFAGLHQLNVESSSLMQALSRTCLIVGKGLDTQDISFIYALRKTREQRARAGAQVFLLLDSPPTLAERLTFHNLAVTPLVINLPRARQSGHYYLGVGATLSTLFPQLGPLFEDMKEDPRVDFPALIRRPSVLAIGLASHNITGHTIYRNDNRIPPEGRRNLGYADVEEHLGGSALTPLMILSALNASKTQRLAVVSAIGREGDVYGQQILRTSEDLGIDTDGVSRNQDASWVSTVLIHTSRLKNGERYPGQRIFLDRGYKQPVHLEAAELEQLRAQLTQSDLRVLYLDKFLGQQHPLPKNLDDIREDELGPILSKDTGSLLHDAFAMNPGLDVVYETGGGGSIFEHVEKRISPYVNVFTAGFPYFASTVLQRSGQALPKSMQPFHPSETWWAAEFDQEVSAIEGFLERFVGDCGSPRSGPRFFRFDATSMIDEMKCRAQRSSRLEGGQRRWFIATLHHYGAIGVDLERNAGWYCKAPLNPDRAVKNTSGAGDSFRGGLMYALLHERRDDETSLPLALAFSSAVATERCYHFKIDDARTAIAQRFGNGYAAFKHWMAPFVPAKSR